ncbi:hypothetical protein [Micromonospora sp. 050-3]|uniref:hypothetical protein n=1 Tax=Micromonospora sp. 050-3 TaxID=2789265 RepID=UPI00397C1F6D
MPLSRLLTLGVGTCTALAMSVPLTSVPASAQSNHSRGGSLVLVGGGLADDNAAIYGDIVRLAGGAGKARIGIFTAAAPAPSEDPDADTPDCNNSVCNGDYYAKLFRSYGVADAQWIPIDLDRPEAAQDPAVVKQINSMTGFFFGGGDQYRYVTTMTRGDAQRDTAARRSGTSAAKAPAATATTSTRSGISERENSAAATRDAAIIAVQPIATLTPVGVCCAPRASHRLRSTAMANLRRPCGPAHRVHVAPFQSAGSTTVDGFHTPVTTTGRFLTRP